MAISSLNYYVVPDLDHASVSSGGRRDRYINVAKPTASSLSVINAR